MNNMGRLRASLEEFAQFGCPVDLSVAVTAAENEKSGNRASRRHTRIASR